MDTILILTKRPTPYWLDMISQLNSIRTKCYIISDMPYEDTEGLITLDKDIVKKSGFHSVSIHRNWNGAVYAWEKALYYSCFNCDESEYVWFIEDDTYFRDAQSLIDLSLMYDENKSDLLFNPWPLETDDPLTELRYDEGTIWTPDIRFFGGDTFTRAFVPVCRMSRRLREHIEILANKYDGLPHLETLVPTICTRNKLKTDIIDQSVFDISFNTMSRISIDHRFLTDKNLKAYHRCKDIASTVYQEQPSQPLDDADIVIGKKSDVVILTQHPTPYWLAMADKVNHNISGNCHIVSEIKYDSEGCNVIHIPDDVSIKSGFQKVMRKGSPKIKERVSATKADVVLEVKDVTATDKALYWLSTRDCLDYVWLIEDDVYFRNCESLISLVKDYENDPADLIAVSCIERTDYSDWLVQKWSIDSKFFGKSDYWQSCLSICRISKRIVNAITEMAELHGSLPYIESLLPTITVNNNWIYRNLAQSVHPYCEEGREIMGCPHPKEDTKYLISLVDWTQKEVHTLFQDNPNLQAFCKVKDIRLRKVITKNNLNKFKTT